MFFPFFAGGEGDLEVVGGRGGCIRAIARAAADNRRREPERMPSDCVGRVLIRRQPLFSLLIFLLLLLLLPRERREGSALRPRRQGQAACFDCLDGGGEFTNRIPVFRRRPTGGVPHGRFSTELGVQEAADGGDADAQH